MKKIEKKKKEINWNWKGFSGWIKIALSGKKFGNYLKNQSNFLEKLNTRTQFK